MSRKFVGNPKAEFPDKIMSQSYGTLSDAYMWLITWLIVSHTFFSYLICTVYIYTKITLLNFSF